MVLWLANNAGNGDIGAAVQQMKSYRQGIIDEYVSGRANGHHLTPSPDGTVATDVPVIHDLRDARKAAEAFIRSQAGAEPGA